MGGGGFLGLGPAPDTSAQDRAMENADAAARRNDERIEAQRKALSSQMISVVKAQGAGTYASRQDYGADQ